MEFKKFNGKLICNFEFKSQTELAQFLLEIASYADKTHHHPDCKIHKAFQLEVTLFTHDKNAITKLDLDLAAFIIKIFQLKNSPK